MKNYGLISGLQSLLTIQRQISVTHHIQVIKKKKKTILSDAKKASDNIQYPFIMEKIMAQKKGTKKNLLNFIAGICKKFTTT